MTTNIFDDHFIKLIRYCENNYFTGYDPYDGLNSKIFNVFPFLKKHNIQLLWIQCFKWSPINFRKIAGIRKEQNPKGLGLFLSGYCNLYKASSSDHDLSKINYLINEIKLCRINGFSGACWGYNFDWQSRAFFQPKGTPSVVVTSFVACALLDAYELTKDDSLLKEARSACDFVLNDLNRTCDKDGDFSLSYSPLDHTQVFNASLLGARLLSRTFSHTHEKHLIEESRKIVSYACKYQNTNGSWTYSPLSFHSWIDNFHTGYNLECIYTYQSISGDDTFKENIKAGLDYYLNTFFEKTGIPRYYSHSMYPIDMHNIAQLIVTLNKLNLFKQNKELVDKALMWGFENMFDQKQGYFYYYKTKYYTIKIPYMRWTQSWMFLALSHYQLIKE